MVIDYKSGGAHVTAQDVYYGLKLQLMTYLLALESAYGKTHGGSMSPAAVVYSYVKNPKIPADAPISYEDAVSLANESDAWQNSGYFSDDIELLTHIDNKFLSYGSKRGPYVPIATKKDQTISSRDLRKVKSTGEFDIMCRYTNHVMAETGRHIGDGQFPIKPYQLNGLRPCTFCDYRTVCRFDSSRNRYNYLSRLSEDDALERMKEVLNDRNNSSEGGENHGCYMDARAGVCYYSA